MSNATINNNIDESDNIYHTGRAINLCSIEEQTSMNNFFNNNTSTPYALNNSVFINKTLKTKYYTNKRQIKIKQKTQFFRKKKKKLI